MNTEALANKISRRLGNYQCEGQIDMFQMMEQQKNNNVAEAKENIESKAADEDFEIYGDF